MDESPTPTSATTNANGGRGKVNIPSNGRRKGMVNTQSQPASEPPSKPVSQPSWHPASQPVIYEIPSEPAPDPPSPPALHSTSQLAPDPPSQPAS